jgi:hypothetical protein
LVIVHELKAINTHPFLPAVVCISCSRWVPPQYPHHHPVYRPFHHCLLHLLGKKMSNDANIATIPRTRDVDIHRLGSFSRGKHGQYGRPREYLCCGQQGDVSHRSLLTWETKPTKEVIRGVYWRDSRCRGGRQDCRCAGLAESNKHRDSTHFRTTNPTCPSSDRSD